MIGTRATVLPWRGRDRLPPGTRLHKYEIIRHIGSGGYGDVYEAIHVDLRRRAAIKILRLEHARDEDVQSNFLREARILASIRDSNVVEVYDFGIHDDGRPWMAMEYLEGHTLRQLLYGEEPFPVIEALHIATAIAHGLGIAHDHDVIHRDIKPENVFLTHEGRVVLVDFGTAKALSEAKKKQTKRVVGTASYLAPERATGDPVDNRVDVYSLGLVFYELLTGVAAFPWTPDMTPALIVARQINEWPVPLEKLAPWLAHPRCRGVRDIVWRAIQKDPRKRTASAHAFREQCQEAIASVRGTPSNEEAAHWNELDSRAASLLPDTEPVSLSARCQASGRIPTPRKTTRISAMKSVAIAALAAVLTASGIAVGTFAVRTLQARSAPSSPEMTASVGASATSVRLSDATDRDARKTANLNPAPAPSIATSASILSSERTPPDVSRPFPGRLPSPSPRQAVKTTNRTNLHSSNPLQDSSGKPAVRASSVSPSGRKSAAAQRSTSHGRCDPMSYDCPL